MNPFILFYSFSILKQISRPSGSKSLCFLLGVLLFSLGCSQKDREAKPLPPDLGQYVYAFTTGTISRTSDIRIQFNTPVAGPEQVGMEVEKDIFSISPSVKGKTMWESQQTLLFRPETPFPSGKIYIGTVRLSQLYQNLPEDLKSFEFDFKVRELILHVEIDGMEAPDPNDLSKQTVKGKVYATDVVDDEAVEKVLKANQNGRALEVSWQHESGSLIHHFTVTDVERGQDTKSVTIEWDGDRAGAKGEGEEKVEILPLGTFIVTEARVVQEAEQYVEVHFSDPIQPGQDLEGLIRILNYDGYYRFVIDGNNVRVYPSSRLSGTYQVRIEPGIRNTGNDKMKDPAQWTLQFEQDKPGVRLTGKGTIMPNSTGLTFPFEAISLNAVEVEVFKIFNNNILQFLQTNEMDGNFDLERVGRVILQKKVPLGQLSSRANPNQWTRYALDLSQLIKRDPNAIYQVRIGFRPEYSTYVCLGNTIQVEDANLVQVGNRLDENGEIISIWNSWYGINGYYNDFSWEHREDPCYPAFYNSENFVQRNVLASDLGITAKKGKDGSMFIAVNNLRTTDPVASAKIEIYDFQKQLITSVETNGEGLGKATVQRQPYFVIASNGQEKGYLKLGDGNSLSLSKFDVAGTETQKGLKGFIYGDRGVWRPGDTLFLNFILEDEAGTLPADHPVTFELMDPRGQVQKKVTVTENVSRIYSFTTVTSAEAPTGNWIARVKAGGAVFDKILKIETVKPNRLKIDLDLHAETLHADDARLSGDLQVNWLHGAPAKNLKAIVEMQMDPATTNFQKYPDYQFDDPARTFSSDPAVIFDGTLNEKGHAEVTANLLNNGSAPGKMTVRFKTRAFEKSGDFSTDNFTLPFYPYQTFTGISMPKNKWGQERMDIDEEGKIDFVAVDAQGNPRSNRRLEAGIYRIDWNWWWDADNNNISRYNSTNHYNAMKATSLTTDKSGKAAWNVKLEDYGRYIVRVCDNESGHCAGKYFFVGYSWYDDESGGRSEAAMLTFASGKSNYNIGETIELTVPAGDKGKILLSLENGSGIIKSWWEEAKEGKNTFRFTATAEMVPTLYVHASLLQPHAQTANDLPIRMYGVIPIEVQDPQTILKPVLKMPEVLAPEQEVKLEIAEQSGRPMAYTIAMVDEGLLDLTRFKTPDPWDAFYAKEALGVKTWDLYDYVLGAFGGELERVLSVGGDAEIQPGDISKNANRFKPVVRHLGPFFLEKGKKATHTIKMPNYVGSVRTMVVAVNKGAYGATDKTTPVRKPLMVLTTLPRVLGPSESLQVPVSVFAMEKKVKNVTVSISESSGLVSFPVDRQQSVSFSEPGDKMVYFDCKIGDETGIARFKISASGGGETATQEIEISIRNPNAYITRTFAEAIESNDSWEKTFEPVGTKGTNSAILELSAIPPIDLGRRLRYLLRYPYGCLEQTISSGFPQLYVSRLLQLDEKEQARVSRNVQATIDRLKNFQNSEGAFVYWPGGGVNQWSNNYAGHFLLEAKALGYTIPPGMLERWESFQQKAARLWDPRQDAYGFYGDGNSQLTQAYRLYTLALSGKHEMGAMNRLRETKNLNQIAKWKLAGAYALAGKPEVAQQLVNSASVQVASYRDISYNFGSQTRDRAIILEVLTLLKDRNRGADMVRTLADELSAEQWLSTQDIGYCLLSIGKFVGDMGPAQKFEFDYKAGNGRLVKAGSTVPVMQIELTENEISNGKIYIKNTGKTLLFTRLILSGQPLIGREVPEENKLKISAKYLSVTGQPLNPASLPQGTDFVAEVTVTHPGLYSGYLRELALSNIFPSGWEIINTRLDGMERFNNSTHPDYLDIRDDRVNIFFDLQSGNSATFRVMLNAAYQGRYYLPGVNCEAMYDNSIYARNAGRWVEVTGPGNI